MGTGGIPANLKIYTRSDNTPAEYKATIDVEFLDEFISDDGDSFEAFITTNDGSGGTGSGNDIASGYRYGFNGKENDNEVEGEGNQIDYGMRVYDPRLGKFLSVDPLTKDYPFYTPYSYAGNKPVWKTDLDGLEENDNVGEKYWKNQPQIDMTSAPGTATNAAGIKRNGLWVAQQVLKQKPEWFSEFNKNRIVREKVMPIVDAQWVRYNPQEASYMWDGVGDIDTKSKMNHHHINGGNKAVLISSGTHYDNYSEVHAYLGKLKKGTKVGRGANGALNALGGLTLLSGVITGDPENPLNDRAIQDPEDYIGNRVFKDLESGLYFEIKSVLISTERTWRDGKIIKERVYKRDVKADVYSGYIWDDELKRFKGVNKVDSLHEEWKYDKGGNRSIINMNLPNSKA
ncbi:MAG TPA: RHS repeat-associated core domain-containing protein [Flavisolibacter sp.]|jgi:RHS repeat-associated protein|nr:RHS repeat-associated core domain-containing protein [Flavisolibacter sp.]